MAEDGSDHQKASRASQVAMRWCALFLFRQYRQKRAPVLLAQRGGSQVAPDQIRPRSLGQNLALPQNWRAVHAAAALSGPANDSSSRGTPMAGHHHFLSASSTRRCPVRPLLNVRLRPGGGGIVVEKGKSSNCAVYVPPSVSGGWLRDHLGKYLGSQSRRPALPD